MISEVIIIVLFIVIILTEKLYRPRLDYIEQSSVLILFFFCAKNGIKTRERKIFKI